MQQANVTIAPEVRKGNNWSYSLFAIRRDGQFIIGGSTEAEAKKRLEQLEANDWKHLDCYLRGHPDPLEWIAHVREQGWTFETFSTVDISSNGRAFFSGNVNEYSAAFRYLVIDAGLVEQIIAAAPEVEVRRYATDGTVTIDAKRMH